MLHSPLTTQQRQLPFRLYPRLDWDSRILTTSELAPNGKRWWFHASYAACFEAELQAWFDGRGYLRC